MHPTCTLYVYSPHDHRQAQWCDYNTGMLAALSELVSIPSSGARQTAKKVCQGPT